MELFFDKANRIITVKSPATEITIQDLITIIRDWEDELYNMEIAKVADASGKEDLGAGEFNTITLKLLNWKLKREASSSPMIFTVRGGNLVAVDADSNPMVPFEPSNNISYDRAKSSSGTMVQDTDIDFIKDIEGGKWKIDGSQMIFCKSDNVTEIARFNLYDKAGNLTTDMTKVYERRRI